MTVKSKRLRFGRLGEIGGDQAMKILTVVAEAAEEVADTDLIEAIEEAISNASLPGKDLEFDFDL